MTAGGIRTTLADRDIYRERLTLIRMFEGLRLFGYEGGYSAARCSRPVARSVDDNSRHIQSTELRCGRSLPARLEP